MMWLVGYVISLVTEASLSWTYVSWAWPGLAVVGIALYNAAGFIPLRSSSQRGVWKTLPTGETVVRAASVGFDRELVKVPLPGCDTVAKVFARAVDQYSERPCLGERGVRKVLKEWNEERQRNFVKLELDEFKWLTYGEVGRIVSDVAGGLASLGLKRGDVVAIYANTCARWQMMAQACFSHGIVVATVYANLGKDAVVYACEQTQARVLITDNDLLGNVADVINSLATVEKVVYLPPRQGIELDDVHFGKFSSSTLISFDDVAILGTSATVVDFEEPETDDVAVIMYTSGSTGNPKGVEIEHKSIVAALAALVPAIPGLGATDVYVAYLPLAHILELCAENTMLSVGAAIGYGSTLTLSDTSAMVAPGSLGDLRAARPTVMAAVPLVLDRIKDGVMKKVNGSSIVVRTLFKMAYASAVRAKRNGWGTPIWDLVVFNKIRGVMGGRLRMMLSGGAPLSGATQTWFSSVFAPLGQGYGLTETCGSGTITHPDDTQVSVVGAPIACCEIKLVDWEQYRNDNVNNPEIGRPQGEIWFHGGNVSRGYYGLPEKTANDYPVDGDGTRYFATGDIGQLEPNGVIKIIDRKKDLIKGRGGEYVSLGRVEGILRNSAFVDNIMVFQNAAHDNPIAVATVHVAELASAAGVEAAGITASPEAKTFILKDLKATGIAGGLKKFEIPARVEHIILEDDPWTPENDLVTSALKLKRRNLMNKYGGAIDAVYPDNQM